MIKPCRGMTIRLHPATDLFMMGVVYAEITSVSKKWIYIEHGISSTKHKIPASWWYHNAIPSNEQFTDKFA